VGSTNLSKIRGEPDTSGPNWNDNPSGPNTNVGGFAGKTWAMVEAGGCLVELTCELEAVGRNNFEGTLSGAFTAHPKTDADTKEMHAMVYAWHRWMDHLQYVVVGSNGEVRKTVDVPLPGMTMMHDMSMTQKYIVTYDQPVTVNFDDVASGPAFPMSWNPD
jgi:carotenoid cleavage dioxygenase-like enzyme